MLKACASVICFGLMILGFVLIVRNRAKAGQKATSNDPPGLWLLIGLGLIGGTVLAVL